MRHPIVEASARLLLFLIIGALSSAQVAKPDNSANTADVDNSAAADGFQIQQFYMSSSGKEVRRHQPPGYISGTILDQSGAVSAGAEVHLTDAGQAWSQEIKSGSNGQFLFANVATGSFRLVVAAPGFTTREYYADLRPGKPI